MSLKSLIKKAVDAAFERQIGAALVSSMARIFNAGIADLDRTAQRPPCTRDECMEHGCSGYGDCGNIASAKPKRLPSRTN